MDSHGVPQKINRHVFKAISFYMNHKNGSSFPEIYNYVKYCNKNLTPVSNLMETVRKSLNNLQRVGLVQKDRNKFKIRPVIEAKKKTGILKKTKKKVETSEESKESNPQPKVLQKKKRKVSDSSLSSDSEGNTTKRLRGDKRKIVADRKGKKVELPRARRHQDREPNRSTNYAAFGTNDPNVDLAGSDTDEHKIAHKINFDNEKTDTGTDNKNSTAEPRTPSESSLDNRTENVTIGNSANSLLSPDKESNNNDVNV